MIAHKVEREAGKNDSCIACWQGRRSARCSGCTLDEKGLLTDQVWDEQKDVFRIRLGGCQIHGNFGIDVSEGVPSARFAGAMAVFG